MYQTAKQRRFVDGSGSKKKSKVASKPSGSKMCIKSLYLDMSLYILLI